MKLHRWNGERWYADDRSVAGRVARWVMWPGGWETFRTWPLVKRIRPHFWTPFSLFGHRLTFFGWGVQMRMRGGYWVLSGLNKPERPIRVYWSPDGTPSSATVWLLRAPREVVYAAEQAQQDHDAMMSRVRGVA